MLNPATFLSGISSLIDDVLGFLNPSSEDFAFADLFGFLDPTSQNFAFSGLTNIATGISNIFNLLNPNSQDFILRRAFVPSEERINAITNLVKGKFAFVDSIKTGINALDETINNLGSSPRLTMTLGATQYTEEQRVVVIDLSWYAPFKQYGDLVLTGFIYLFFLWRIFISIPNIINGFGGSIQGDYMLHEIHDFNSYGVGRSSSLDRIRSIDNGHKSKNPRWRDI